jgi:hypothetical protein
MERMAAAKVYRGGVIELRFRYEDGAVSPFVVRANDNGSLARHRGPRRSCSLGRRPECRGEKSGPKLS